MNVFDDLLQHSKPDLVQKIYRVSWNRNFGCYNKTGFEEIIWPEIATRARWLIFFDLDDLHELNKPYDSYAPVDAMIYETLSILRKTDYVCGQLNSGDEFIVAITESDGRASPTRESAEGLQARLVESLAKQGMSATFAIVEVKFWDLADNLAPAIAEVKVAKRARGITR